MIEEKYESQEILLYKENFLNYYCNLKNWNKFDLTHEQIIEIKNQTEWKTPNLKNNFLIKS